MKQSRFIEQILVIGDGQKMAAAIVQPNFAFVKEWAKRHHQEIGSTLQEIAGNEKVKERIMEEIEEGNKHFGQWETIKKIELTPEVWTVDNELLTPTFKPKREVIIKKYKDLYDRIYA
jgi:long-chain acyl-CoA synthetase